jgi:6-phosphogluconolactonase (cycloisomerase 2 family)
MKPRLMKLKLNMEMIHLFMELNSTVMVYGLDGFIMDTKEKLFKKRPGTEYQDSQ